MCPARCRSPSLRLPESRASNLEDILLTPNPYTWSKAAHVLYVDSPAGTGLSYTQGATSYATNDTATVEDLYAFLVGWLEQYPEFKGRPLYLAGERAAGRGRGPGKHTASVSRIQAATM